VMGLGAYPAAVPHTRPARIVGTSRDEVLALRAGVVQVQLDLPAGVATMIEWQTHEMGLASLALWAQVPHYAAGMANPAASLALLDGVAEIGAIHLPGDTIDVLRAASTSQAAQLDRLIAASSEHTAMIGQLELAYDTEAPQVVRSDGPLPSGDELAAELERFLRSQEG
jgi:hypothetical protein